MNRALPLKYNTTWNCNIAKELKIGNNVLHIFWDYFKSASSTQITYFDLLDTYVKFRYD